MTSYSVSWLYLPDWELDQIYPYRVVEWDARATCLPNRQERERS